MEDTCLTLRLSQDAAEGLSRHVDAANQNGYPVLGALRAEVLPGWAVGLWV